MEPTGIGDKQILDMLFSRTAELNTLWNIWFGVALGLLGVLGSGKGFVASWRIKVILSVGFAAFAISNVLAIDSIHHQRMILSKHLTIPWATDLASVVQPRGGLYKPFHAGLDLLILSAIWFVSWGTGTDDASRARSDIGTTADPGKRERTS